MKLGLKKPIYVAVSEPDLMDAMERWLVSSGATCSYVSTASRQAPAPGRCCEVTPPVSESAAAAACGPATDRTAADVSAAGGALAAVLRGIEIVTLQVCPDPTPALST